MQEHSVCSPSTGRRYIGRQLPGFTLSLNPSKFVCTVQTHSACIGCHQSLARKIRYFISNRIGPRSGRPELLFNLSRLSTTSDTYSSFLFGIIQIFFHLKARSKNNSAECQHLSHFRLKAWLDFWNWSANHCGTIVTAVFQCCNPIGIALFLSVQVYQCTLRMFHLS